MKKILLLTVLAVMISPFASFMALYADQDEARTMLGIGYYPLHVFGFSAGLFIHDEQRFESSDLVYDKQTYGLPVRTPYYFSLMPFYEHQDLTYPGKKPGHQGIDGFEATIEVPLWYIRISDRNRVEYFTVDEFYRYRNQLQLSLVLPFANWLSPYVAYELRYDYDQDRINQNNFLAGVVFKPSDALSLKLYIDREYKRRNAADWALTNLWTIAATAVL